MLRLFKKQQSDKLFDNPEEAVVNDRSIVLEALRAYRHELIWCGQLIPENVEKTNRLFDEIVNIENQIT